MAKAELVNLTTNTDSEVDQSAWGADKETAYRGWPALSFRFPSDDCSRTDSRHSYLTKVGFCWRHEVVTNELEYPNEKDLAACVGGESAAQLMIVHRRDGECRVKSVLG